MHPNFGPRRRHSTEFKSKVLAACAEPGASISRVALAHGLNANLVRKWRSGRDTKRGGIAITPTATSATTLTLPNTAPEFVAVEMPVPPKAVVPAAAEPMAASSAPMAEQLIQIELRRGPLHLNVHWPTSAAEDCRAWLSELSAGLLKRSVSISSGYAPRRWTCAPAPSG